MVVNIGVIGTGNIGSDHIRRITQDCHGARVVAVSDVDADRAQAVAATVDAKTLSSGAELIALPEVDAVLVSSSGPTHAEYVLGCLDADKPVLCEKPLATTAADCLRIVEAEQSLGRRLVQVGFMRRFDPHYRDMKRLLDSGDLGEPLMIHCVHRNPFSVEAYTSQMATKDTAIHEIDIVRWLLDEEITSVQVLRPKGTTHCHDHLADPQIMLFATASGVRIDVEVFVNCQYGYDIQCETVGETGTAKLPDPAQVLVRSNATLTQPIPQTWKERFAAAFTLELQSWIDAAADGTVTGPGAWDGYAAAVIGDSTVEALDSGEILAVPMRQKPAFYM
ncbi:MAG TPA: Gfo/Idh/MocA family oxidoreductase [Stackebrandtia sp.]|uniref:Gfo/Idh/MocA family protein n=1 Tax=Stackebrandtia sp. TaxID=2023065 RepID=UPI002D74AA81|nr:Gfo/Idh/MocA family oxidoreductase [Stackebrandtia sp.]HZE37243.1 Gfo/Idh/MocA family oxidoreductase [Stackebrandtia sp.]